MKGEGETTLRELCSRPLLFKRIVARHGTFVWWTHDTEARDGKAEEE